MTKRRGVSNSRELKKKRSENSSLTPANQEKSILNDGLLNLYKKDLMKKDNVSKDEGDISSEKQLQSENMQNLKTPARDKERKSTEMIAEATNLKTPARDKKRKSTAPVAKYSTTNFDDVGGMVDTLEDMRWMFMHHKLSKKYRSRPPIRGILLHGPPGCGKTHLARAIAGELELPLLEVGVTELVNGISGESEGKIREVFEAAIATGRCILFLDSIQAICLKGSDNVMNHRMSIQLQKSLDELVEKDKEGQVMVMAATHQLDSVDTLLRAGNRFSREVPIGMPDKETRQSILEILCRDMNLSPDFSLQWLAKSTPGYVGGDLTNLATLAEEIGCKRLGVLTQSFFEDMKGDNPSDSKKISPSKLSNSERINKGRKCWDRLGNIPEEVENNFHITEDDFKKAMKQYVPFAQKEGFASVDSVTWDDVGALEDVKKELQHTIVWPIDYSDFYEKNNLSTPKGILLFGPKGCGKTLVAKAIANECNLNFLSVNGPELLSMYVGESERAIRNTFERAQNSAPCVIFFDEFDALCPSRSSTKENAPVERVVNQLLCGSDGTRSRKQVFLVAATNRLDKIDSAMLRPGRLEKVYYVGLPSADGRRDILRSLTKNKTQPQIADDLSFETIANDSRCEEFSGADLAHLVRQATSIAIEEIVSQGTEARAKKEDLIHIEFVLTHSHFNQALDVVKPSISEEDRKYFQKHSSLAHARISPSNKF